MTNLELATLINKLVALGEDADELHFWLSIYDDMAADEQAELTANLQQELTNLEKLAPRDA